MDLWKNYSEIHFRHNGKILEDESNVEFINEGSIYIYISNAVVHFTIALGRVGRITFRRVPLSVNDVSAFFIVVIIINSSKQYIGVRSRCRHRGGRYEINKNVAPFRAVDRQTVGPVVRFCSVRRRWPRWPPLPPPLNN